MKPRSSSKGRSGGGGASTARHRPGVFKILNKAHKSGRHKSNRGLKRSAGSGAVSKATGTLAAKTLSSQRGGGALKAARIRRLSKADQRNRLKLLRQAQLAKSLGQTVEQMQAVKRLTGGAKTADAAVAAPQLKVAPTLVTFVCADPGISLPLLQAMVKAAASSCQSSAKSGQFQFRYTRPTTSGGSVFSGLVECLDLAKVSDALVLVFQAGSEFTLRFRRVLSALYAQGLPGQLHAAVLTTADSQKDRKAWEKALLADLVNQGFGLPGDCGLLAVRGSEELAGLLRRIASKRAATGASTVAGGVSGKARAVRGYPAFAKSRCYGLVESISQLSSADSSSVSDHSIRLVTHIRGSGQVGLNPGDLIHLVGLGDYQIVGLSSCNVENESAVEDSPDVDMPDDADDVMLGAGDGDIADIEIDEDDPAGVDGDAVEAASGAAKNSELAFPDEVDTPKDVPARQRFAKYRCHTSEKATWEPWSDLPEAFASLAYFSNFRHARNRVAKAAKAASYELRVGSLVTMHLRPLTTNNSAVDSGGAIVPGRCNRTLVWYRMLEHEDKMTLVNCSVRLNPDRKSPLASGQQVAWQIGWRRFSAAPVLSECDTPSTASGSPRLCLRLLAPGDRAVASFYAPLTFTPAPVIALFESLSSFRPEQLIQPLLSGSVETCDPSRIVLKRVILSGQPFKIHKRSAVIRYLFFSPEDVNHYRDANLRTKHGRRGKILEPVGTHGLCKCRFDGPVTNMDTVLLDLFKRQFPKLTYTPEIALPDATV